MKTAIRRITRSVGGSNAARRFVRRVARDHGLRCILYHEIAEPPSVFTAGLNVTTAPDTLADHLEMLARDYDFVSIDHVVERRLATRTGRPPILVTFDDAYESVASVAADICLQAGVPSVFFVNGAFVDNVALALDNLVAWVFNTVGLAPLATAAGRPFADLSEFFGPYLASITLEERARVYDVLAEELPQSPAEMAAEASLYVTSPALAALPDSGMFVGNHTWSHAYCRRLDSASVETEIESNRRFLESIVSDEVAAFSYPYGSRFDATEAMTATLAQSGHRAAFLVEAEANRGDADPMRLCRVSVGSVATRDLFADLEVLPVLRRARNELGRRGKVPVSPA